MASLKEILSWFEKNKYPTQEQFKESWTSFWHKSEKMPMEQVVDLQNQLDDKALKSDLKTVETELKDKASKEELANVVAGLVPMGSVSNLAELETKPKRNNDSYYVEDQLSPEGDAYIYRWDDELSLWVNTKQVVFKDVLLKKDLPNQSYLNISILYPTDGKDGSHIYTLPQAIDIVPFKERQKGLIISFYIDEYNLEHFIFKGGDFRSTDCWYKLLEFENSNKTEVYYNTLIGTGKLESLSTSCWLKSGENYKIVIDIKKFEKTAIGTNDAVIAIRIKDIHGSKDINIPIGGSGVSNDTSYYTGNGYLINADTEEKIYSIEYKPINSGFIYIKYNFIGEADVFVHKKNVSILKELVLKKNKFLNKHTFTNGYLLKTASKSFFSALVKSSSLARFSIVNLYEYGQVELITFQSFKSSELNGSLFLDSSGNVIGAHTALTSDQYAIDVSVPSNAKYFVLSLPPSIEYFTEIKLKGYIVSDSDKKDVLIADKRTWIDVFDNITRSEYYVTNREVGELVDIQNKKISNTGLSAITIPCYYGDTLKIRGVGGESARLYAFLDSSYRLITKSVANLDSYINPIEVDAPKGSFLAIISLRIIDYPKSTVELLTDYFPNDKNKIHKIENLIKEPVINFLPFRSTWKQSSKMSLALCSLHTESKNKSIPFHKGFLFHEFPYSSGKLFYGTNLKNANLIGTVDANPLDYLLAMSPKDGRVILTKRGKRDLMLIWDGETTIKLFKGAKLQPMGWLYNSGVEFITDGKDEYCLFAEYDGSLANRGGFYVWKGKYPYTSENDWETVFHKELGYYGTPKDDTITHFHCIKKDPWSNNIYLTSGDKPNQLKWWFSNDLGDTWNLLTDNSTNGWEENTCRLIHFLFTDEYIYWATDYGVNHSFNRIKRDANGLIDISSREKLCDLPFAQATNSICLVESPNGIFFYDRIDSGALFEPYWNDGLQLMFWSFTVQKLYKTRLLKTTNKSWGGHRGKCYINYTSGQCPTPAIGFSKDTPCPFDIVGADGENIGTIFYDL